MVTNARQIILAEKGCSQCGFNGSAFKRNAALSRAYGSSVLVYGALHPSIETTVLDNYFNYTNQKERKFRKERGLLLEGNRKSRAHYSIC